MALIRVTASQVRNSAESLRGLNQQFNSQVQNLQAAEESLNGMWDGQANDAFHAAFLSDKEYMTQFYNLINKYCEALDSIATEYENAENINLDTATRRSF
ncbi:WXG100 family type VII secretion target [bacterium D16-54]|nr:WXG100 family type VII secretion target [bacterium D16-54]RKJ13351.1 WXG100 family type VII secretion target [bacterium D16-56]